MLELEPETAEVIMRDQDGYPLLTKNAYGEGFVLFFNAPLESWFASQAELASTSVPYEGIYKYAKECAGICECVEKKNALSVISIHKIDEQVSVVVVLNNTEKEIEEQFTLNGVKINTVYKGTLDVETLRCVIPPVGVVVFEVTKTVE